MSEVLQEFLIPVHFKVDQASEARMRDSIRTATLQSNLLADALEGSIKLFGQVMRKVAENLDQMFYASQRTAASVENIKAFGYAAAQLGSSIGEANGALEAFGKFLRSNPGSYSLLERMGISTKENGKIRDTGKLMEDLGEKLAKMPLYMQQQYASLFGISDKVLYAITSPEFRKKAEERRALLRSMGLDENKAAEASKNFAQALGRVEMALSAIATKIEAAVIERFGETIRGLGDFFVKHGDEMTEAVIAVAGAVGEIGKQFLFAITGTNDIDKAFSTFLKTIKEVADWVKTLVSRIQELVGIVNKFGEDSGLTWFLNKFGYYGPPNQNSGTGGNGPSGRADGTESGSPDKRNWWQRNAPGFLGGKEAPPPGAAGGLGTRSATRSQGQVQQSENEIVGGQRVGGTRSWRNNNPGNIEYGAFAKGMGATASDGRFAIFPSYEAGRKAQEKLLFESKGYRDLTLAGAISRWAPASENNVPAYLRAMGADPNARMKDFSPQQRVALLDAMQKHEGWRAGKIIGGETPKQSAGGGSVIGSVFGISPAQAEIDRRWKEHLNQPKSGGPFGGLPGPDAFNKPLDGGVNQSWNRATTNHMSFKTDIKVDGAADPAATAALVGSNVDVNHRNFANKLRNFQGAAQ